MNPFEKYQYVFIVFEHGRREGYQDVLDSFSKTKQTVIDNEGFGDYVTFKEGFIAALDEIQERLSHMKSIPIPKEDDDKKDIGRRCSK